MMNVLIAILAAGAALFGFNMLMGYRKGNITLDLDQRHQDLRKQAEDVTKELEKQGKEAAYKGNGFYVIDGIDYAVRPQNVSMGGAALQRTVLIPVSKLKKRP
ncbi:hypothetical protein NCCP2716_28240 [Sporosarcina sp. NCCP-2716]|uniref:hypothetical protein n=1 Tax=Sporosarcina sp. NCCP-2716 TaxID=2943679 RepID=UPI002041E4F1|nr:hypothetical protein [Sporosarcina sp. NCCP-2716]GKV70326.1 hypothetical protein NCCP2716_28240 [Sporosarcina sp. NCCP-2716]